jgi:MFS family permease
LSFPQEFGLDHEVGTPAGDRDEWIVGFVNAAPYISSALLGVWISDPLNNLFGRRGEIFITSLSESPLSTATHQLTMAVLIATPIASGFTHSWEGLAAARLVLGIGMGAKGEFTPRFPKVC